MKKHPDVRRKFRESFVSEGCKLVLGNNTYQCDGNNNDETLLVPELDFPYSYIDYLNHNSNLEFICDNKSIKCSVPIFTDIMRQ